MAEVGSRGAALMLDLVLAAKDALSLAIDMDEAMFLGSRLHQNAVIQSLEIIGEAAGKVSVEARAAAPGIPWRDVVTMRHRHDPWLRRRAA